MATARRWYFYAVAFISQMMLFAGAHSLTQELLDARGRTPTAQALSIALIIVGLPVYVLHWWLAQRAVQHGDDTRNAVLRKVYIYAAQAVTLLTALAALRTALELILSGQFSLAALDEHAAGLLVSLVFWGYHFWLARSDAALEAESGGGATARRLFQFGLAAVGLWWWASGLRLVTLDVVRAISVSRVALDLRPSVLSEDAATMLIGLIAWLPVWYALQRRVMHEADEQHSLVRKIYLYAAVFLGAGFSLFSLAAWLQSFIAILLGKPMPPADLLVEGSGNSIITAAIGALVWAYHARVLQADTRLTDEVAQQTSIRRLYNYLVAALSLTALVVGVANIGEMLVRMFMNWPPDPFAAVDWWRERLSWGIAATLVGLPVWLRAWRRMQHTALAADAPGRDERRATLRKIYLYGVALAGALVVLFNLSSAAYQFLQIVLGESRGALLAGNITGALVNAVVSAVAWIYHLFAIRRDNRLTRETAGVRAERRMRLGVVAGTHEFNTSLQQQLERELPGVETRVIDPRAADYAAQMQQTDLLVLPLAELLGNAPLAAAVTSAPAKVLLVPPYPQGFSLLGQASAPRTAQLVQQTMQWIQSQMM